MDIIDILKAFEKMTITELNLIMHKACSVKIKKEDVAEKELAQHLGLES
jgi:hypothetical protein